MQILPPSRSSFRGLGAVSDYVTAAQLLPVLDQLSTDNLANMISAKGPRGSKRGYSAEIYSGPFRGSQIRWAEMKKIEEDIHFLYDQRTGRASPDVFVSPPAPPPAAAPPAAPPSTSGGGRPPAFTPPAFTPPTTTTPGAGAGMEIEEGLSSKTKIMIAAGVGVLVLLGAAVFMMGRKK